MKDSGNMSVCVCVDLQSNKHCCSLDTLLLVLTVLFAAFMANLLWLIHILTTWNYGDFQTCVYSSLLCYCLLCTWTFMSSSFPFFFCYFICQRWVADYGEDVLAFSYITLCDWILFDIFQLCLFQFLFYGFCEQSVVNLSPSRMTRYLSIALVSYQIVFEIFVDIVIWLVHCVPKRVTPKFKSL